MQQEPFLFNTTIYQNVEFGLVGTEWEKADSVTKRELVEQACKEAFADEFISRLPEVSDYSALTVTNRSHGGCMSNITRAMKR